jgi:hypothetical protein
MRSAWLHRLWLPFLLTASGSCLIAPIVLGQLPIIINRTPEETPIKVSRKPMLEAPIETTASAGAGWRRGFLEIIPAEPAVTATPRPLPGPPNDVPPIFEIEVMLPEASIEPTRALPNEPIPAFEIVVVLPQPPIEPAIFGSVIGMGPAPAPTWFGPGQDANTMPEDAGRMVSFCTPIAGMPGDPSSDGIQMYLMERTIRRRGVTLRADDGIHMCLTQRTLPTLPVEDNDRQEPAPPPQAVLPQIWPGCGCPAPVPCRCSASQPSAAPQRRAAPLGSRVYEWMIWPLQILARPFREF